ncbi:MAG: N-acetylmuramoyl-L-alanine amidase family protein [Anaerolineae bacterium]
MVRRGFLKGIQRLLLLMIALVVLGIIYQSCRVYMLFEAIAQATPVPTAPAIQAGKHRLSSTIPATPSPAPAWTAAPTPTPGPPKIGIVAGHYLNDSGALCPDGLREVDITLAVAERVVAYLKERGYQAEILGEFDEAIQGYKADAFVAIHADSCDVPGASGFKIAHVAHSAIPEEENRLVECLHLEYQKATGLTYHEDSITDDMLYYHALRKIDLETPGAIIELGFMGDDRYLLVYRQHTLAKGIVNGISCFLEGRGNPPPQVEGE